MAFKKNITLDDILRIIVRWKWLTIYSVLISVLVSSFYCVIAKEMYESSAAILVIPQEVPASYVKTTISYRLEKRLNTLSKQILSRTRLLALIDKLNLFPEDRKRMTEEEVVSLMRKRVNININKKYNAFYIRYIDENPATATRVTSNLSSMFIDENIRIRERQATGTTEFFQTEMLKAKKTLDKKDEEVKKFRIKYFGELPEQLDSNIKSLNRMEDKMKTLSESKRDLEEKRVQNEKELVELKTQAEEHNVDLSIVDKIVNIDESVLSRRAKSLLRQIGEKKAEVARLRLQYTESHPAIRQAMKVIDSLEEELHKEQGIDEKGIKVFVEYATIPPEVKGLVDKITVLSERKKNLDKEIENLEKEKIVTQQNIKEYSRRIEETPRVELQLQELTRDYSTVKKYYETLLTKKMNAQLSENLENKQKGEQFELLDPASFSKIPFTPDRPRIMLYGFMVALIIGFGGPFLIEFLNKTIRNSGEFKEFFDIPILVSLPLIMTDREEGKRRMRKTLILGGLVVYGISFSTFIIVYIDKIEKLLLFLKQ